jgi:hypothetical protein
MRRPLGDDDVRLVTDASLERVGYLVYDSAGACERRDTSFEAQGRWPLEDGDVMQAGDMACLEAVAVLVALHAHAPQWRGRTVRVVSDNAAVMAVLRRGRADSERLAGMMRDGFAVLAEHDVQLSSSHVRTQDNPADVLSRVFPAPPGACSRTVSATNAVRLTRERRWKGGSRPSPRSAARLGPCWPGGRRQ